MFFPFYLTKLPSGIIFLCRLAAKRDVTPRLQTPTPWDSASISSRSMRSSVRESMMREMSLDPDDNAFHRLSMVFQTDFDDLDLVNMERGTVRPAPPPYVGPNKTNLPDNDDEERLV